MSSNTADLWMRAPCRQGPVPIFLWIPNNLFCSDTPEMLIHSCITCHMSAWNAQMAGRYCLFFLLWLWISFCFFNLFIYFNWRLDFERKYAQCAFDVNVRAGPWYQRARDHPLHTDQLRPAQTSLLQEPGAKQKPSWPAVLWAWNLVPSPQPRKVVFPWAHYPHPSPSPRATFWAILLAKCPSKQHFPTSCFARDLSSVFFLRGLFSPALWHPQIPGSLSSKTQRWNSIQTSATFHEVVVLFATSPSLSHTHTHRHTKKTQRITSITLCLGNNNSCCFVKTDCISALC